MSNVEFRERFNLEEITITNENGESVVVSRASLIHKGGLLKHFVIVCPNERNFIVKLSLTLEMLEQFARFLQNETMALFSADNCFRMYLISRRYFIGQLQKVCFDYLRVSIHDRNVCRIHDLSRKHYEKRLQYHCWDAFNWSDGNLFDTCDFQSCEVTTLFKLLTCPVYHKLEEFHLLLGLRVWVDRKFTELRKINDNVSRRDVIRPFISLIRFLIIQSHLIKKACNKFQSVYLSRREIRSIRKYRTQKNVAILRATISGNVKRRNIEDYSSSVALKRVKPRMSNSNKVMNENFRFAADIWVPENCVVKKIELPITHLSPEGIEVLVGVKSTYNQDFLYERSICDEKRYVHLEKYKLLPKRSFHIFSVKVSKKEIGSSFITVNKRTREYVPIYDFCDETTRFEEEKTKFSCKIFFIY
ncbi:uncharacterized protein LOC111631727 [Centruroides sculpturatus]|uniref:uncharacterized protein LOC111631727 n=1 Tax=Centruroides sculpturatus TaxID=218467 RepID=UPI000C6E254D|nr:uncharacterized protein LOC111631727 [Centruroides sculpturatus]